MKIFHIVWGLEVGGIETMLVNIANGQAHLGHIVSVVVINDKECHQIADSFDSAVKIIRLHRCPGSKNPWPIARLNLLLWHHKPDIIHFHALNMPRLVSKRFRRHSITTLHTICHPEDLRHVSQSSHIAAISREVADDLRRRSGASATVVLNGINSANIMLRDTGRPLGSPLRIVQVGRLNHKVKGQDLMIECMALLAKRGINAELDFIGDGPSRKALCGLAARLGVTDKVHLLGAMTQEEIFNRLRDYDLLVQPSRIEGFGLTVAEAMAAQLPVAVSGLNALTEVIDNGACGYIFKSNDAASAAECIADISRVGIDAKKVCAARERAAQLYSIDATIRGYLSLYSQILSK